MTGRPRPIDADRLAEVIVKMIEAHCGRPCPTRREIIEWTGLQRRQVWPFLASLQERGLIEVEEYNCRPANLRRMRVVGGAWTGWTARKAAMGCGRVISPTLEESENAGA